MNPFVDTLMIAAFILFLVFIFRGYHLSKLKERDEDTKK